MAVIDLSLSSPIIKEKTPTLFQKNFSLSQIATLDADEIRKINFRHVKLFGWEEFNALTAEEREALLRLVEEDSFSTGNINGNSNHSNERMLFSQYVENSFAQILKNYPNYTERPSVQEMLTHPKIRAVKVQSTSLGQAQNNFSREGISSTYMLRLKRSTVAADTSDAVNNNSSTATVATDVTNTFNSVATVGEKSTQLEEPPTDFFQLIDNAQNFEFDRLAPLKFQDLTIHITSRYTKEEREDLDALPPGSQERWDRLSTLFEKYDQQFQNLKFDQIKDKNGVSLLNYLGRSLAKIPRLEGLPNPAFVDLLNNPDFNKLARESTHFKSLLPKENLSEEELQDAQAKGDSLSQLYRHHGRAMEEAEKKLPTDDLSTQDIKINKEKPKNANNASLDYVWSKVFRIKGWGLDVWFLINWMAFGLKKDKEILKEKIQKLKDKIADEKLEEKNLDAILYHISREHDLESVNGTNIMTFEMWGLAENGERILISYQKTVKEYLAGLKPAIFFLHPPIIPGSEQDTDDQRRQVQYGLPGGKEEKAKANTTTISKAISKLTAQIEEDEAELDKLVNTTVGLYNQLVKKLQKSKRRVEERALDHGNLLEAMLSITTKTNDSQGRNAIGEGQIKVKKIVEDGEDGKYRTIEGLMYAREFLREHDPKILLDFPKDRNKEEEVERVRTINSSKIKPVLDAGAQQLNNEQTDTSTVVHQVTKLLELFLQLSSNGLEMMKTPKF